MESRLYLRPPVNDGLLTFATRENLPVMAVHRYQTITTAQIDNKEVPMTEDSRMACNCVWIMKRAEHVSMAMTVVFCDS